MFGKAHEKDKLKNQRTLAWGAAYLVVGVLVVSFCVIIWGGEGVAERANAFSGIISSIVIAALGVIANYGHSSRTKDNPQ